MQSEREALGIVLKLDFEDPCAKQAVEATYRDRRRFQWR